MRVDQMPADVKPLAAHCLRKGGCRLDPDGRDKGVIIMERLRPFRHLEIFAAQRGLQPGHGLAVENTGHGAPCAVIRLAFEGLRGVRAKNGEHVRASRWGFCPEILSGQISTVARKYFRSGRFGARTCRPGGLPFPPCQHGLCPPVPWAWRQIATGCAWAGGRKR